jgi:hypothetical protein
VALPSEISEGRHEFPPRSDVPEGHRSAAAQLGLEVEGQESMENVVGQKSQ